VTQLYAPGTTIPVDGGVHADIQQRLQTANKADRVDAERDAFIAQRFPAWQVYPIKTGRWRLKYYGMEGPGNTLGEGGNDPIAAVFALLYFLYAAVFSIVWLLFAPGKWVKAPTIVQILDPASGRPIAEHDIEWRSLYLDPAALTASAPSTLVLLGDPRVCGLVGQVSPQGQVTIAGTAFNRQGKWRVKSRQWTPQYIGQNSGRLMSAAYREYDSHRCGPWLQDSPQPPKGGRSRWTRLKPPSR
jgi:hypothetical protein